MKNIFLSLFFLSILLSCKNFKETEKVEIVKVEDSSSIHKNTAIEEIAEPNREFKNDFDILLTGNYRFWENENPANSLTKDWIDLYEKNGKFHLGKANFSLKNGYDDCIGDSTK